MGVRASDGLGGLRSSRLNRAQRGIPPAAERLLALAPGCSRIYICVCVYVYMYRHMYIYIYTYVHISTH